MNPGPTEEVGKTAAAIVDSLKSQPAVLALIVLNIVFITFVYFGAKDTRDSFDKAMTSLLLQQQKVAELLYNCAPIVPGGKP